MQPVGVRVTIRERDELLLDIELQIEVYPALDAAPVPGC